MSPVRNAIRVRCGQCHRPFFLGEEEVVERPLEGQPNTIDVGVVCPRGHFTHSFYTSPVLKDEARRLQGMRADRNYAMAQRSYTARWKKFQTDIQALLEQAT